MKAAKSNMSTVIIAATGPSLGPELIAEVIASGLPVIAISDNYRCFPDAVLLYSPDYLWWKYHIGNIRGKFKGRLVTIDPEVSKEFPEVELIPCVDWQQMRPGLSGVQGAITQGASSGYQALHIAYNEGAWQRYLLVGYDYGASGRGHWFGDHPAEINPGVPSDFQTMLAALEVLAQDMGKQGAKVVNCTPTTAVKCFQRLALEDALKL